MASTNKKEQPMARQANGLGTKGRGRKSAMGFNKKKESIKEEGRMERVDSLEFAKSMRKDEIKLERKEPSDGSVKSQNSLIVRGKKEGRRLLNGLSGRMNRENKSSSGKSNRRESLVQLRVRALEAVQGSKTKDRSSALKAEALPCPYKGPAPPIKGSESTDLTPKTTHTQGSSSEKRGRQRQKLQKHQSINSKPHKSSNLLRKADTTAKEFVAPSHLASVDGNERKPRFLHKKDPSFRTRNRSEVPSTSVHDFEADPRAHRPSEAQVFSLAARADHGAPRKSVAPTIRERITMFESAKTTQSTSIVALLGAGATGALKRRIADGGAEDGAEVNDIMKRVEYGHSEEKLQSPQMGTMEEPSLTRGSIDKERKHSKSPISRYLDERKRSSISTQGSIGDGKVNGHYVSAFASRGSGVASPETTKAVMQALKATSPKKSTSTSANHRPPSISSPAKLGLLRKPAHPRSGRNSPTLSPAFQDMVMSRQRERNALSAATSRHTSRQPSPHSIDGHSSIGKRQSQPQVLLTGGPVRPPAAVPQNLAAPPAPPSGTLPGTIDNMVAELIALAAEHDESIISMGVAEDYHEIEGLGGALGGAKEVPIEYNQHLDDAAARTNGQSRVANRAVAPRTRTPLQRSRSSLSRMLGRDGPAPDRERDDVGTPAPTSAFSGENKENIPSDEDSSHGAQSGQSGKDDKRKVSEGRAAEMRRKEEIGIRREDEKTLVVRSEVVISEPKPLRLVEISRMLRMARFGRSRSGGRLTGY